MPFVTIFRRAFTSNLQTVSASEPERAALVAGGIEQPTIQNYFAWRRSLMVFVVISTVLSAGLSTYREFTETHERLDIAETISKHLPQNAQAVLPAVLNAVGTETDEDEEQESTAAKKPEPHDATQAAAEKTAKEESTDADDEKPETALGAFADSVELLSIYILPPAALAVIFKWTNFILSFRIIIAAFAFSFVVPILITFCPWSWWEHAEPAVSAQKQPLQYYQLMMEGVVEGMKYLVTLLPAILSLVPGVQKACIRVKTLLPQSVLPGWFLVAASPFYALFLLVIFVAVNQVASDLLFLGGMLLFVSAPLVYAIRADVFARPLSSEQDYQRIRGVQRIVGAMTAIAGGLIVAYLTTQEVMGVRLFGLDHKTALLQPLDLVEFFLEIMGRSMFMTVLGADVFMRMNLGVWKNSRNFYGSPEAEQYDRVMAEMERVC